MKFKAGYKVICTKQSNRYTKNYFTIGKEYEVCRLNYSEPYYDIQVTGDDSTEWNVPSKDFELVEDKLPHELLGLPKYWTVKKDESDQLWDKFWNWYNDYYGIEEDFYWRYFGYDGTDYGTGEGTNAANKTKDFKNNPTLITLEERDRIVNNKQSQPKEGLKPISQTYSIDGFTFIIGDNGISIPGKSGYKTLIFENSKKATVKKFRQALDKFCDEMDI